MQDIKLKFGILANDMCRAVGTYDIFQLNLRGSG